MGSQVAWLCAARQLALFGLVGLTPLSWAQQANPMVVPMQLWVNEMGAAVNSVPIQVAPGIGGIEPKLSLEYSSQGGPGLAGHGWNISGLSAITRCPQIQGTDNARIAVSYSASDRFCIDGQRLVVTSGTYSDGFSKITSHGTMGSSPEHFIVKTKAGLTMEYGRTANSLIKAQSINSVRVWAFNRVTDTKGNFMAVEYLRDLPNGQYYPSNIRYTGRQNINTGTQEQGSSNAVFFDDKYSTDTKPSLCFVSRPYQEVVILINCDLYKELIDNQR